MPRQAPPAMPVVLLAIEALDCLEFVQAHLSGAAVECRCASNVADLTALIDSTPPVLAVLDLDFAGGCMLEFCLTHGTLLKDVPVIFCSRSSDEHFDRAMHAVKQGALDFLRGDFDEKNLNRLDVELERILDRFNSKNLDIASIENTSDGKFHAKSLALAPSVPEILVRTSTAVHSKMEIHSIVPTSAIQSELELHLRGNSPSIASIRRVIEDVAQMKATVLIHGESGTGKELVATAIHRLSNRSEEPFVPVNMSTIPHGLAESTLFGHEKGSFTSAHGIQIGWCEAADGGTLFLDEIGEMELSIQPKLLRFLQESTIQRVGAHTSRKVDVRVIAATNRDLKDLVAERKMREDLYFRLHVVPIHLPPLRDRREDIELLASLFLERSCETHHRQVDGFTDEAMRILERYSWPGNVRQLENIVERTVIFARGRLIDVGEIPPEVHFEACFDDHQPVRFNHSFFPQLPGSEVNVGPALTNGAAAVRQGLPSLSPMQRHERNAIVEALHRVDGHVIDAANLLGVGQATIYRKIKQYHIPHQRKRRRTPK